jgi:thiosulfate/3-mercaptopyruvate sulfurtransferase
MMKKLTTIAGVLIFVFTCQVYASDALVSTEWVANNLNNSDVRIVEVSVEPGQFERGHVPGAVNLRWHTDLVDPVKRDIVSKEAFEELMSRHGIDNNTTVVLYGDHNNWFAAWGAWVFTMYGHENLKLMDGGRDKWTRENRQLSSRPASHRPANYQVGQMNEHLRARLSDVIDVVEGGASAGLVDIRSNDEYTGRVIAPEGIQELAIRAGHIPGAVNVPWGTIVNPDDGTFLPEDELRRIYADKGIDGTDPVIVYCRIGERSSHTWFALNFILGYDVKNYDGSWTEYGNAVGVPINNPSGTVWTGK